MSFVVAIVGRPNVGKSRLFNRITSGDEAIVHGEPGVTRDRQYGAVRVEGRELTVVDTGGIVPESNDELLDRMDRQADVALEEADAVVVLMDGREGVLSSDRRIVERLRSANRPVYFAVNKIDPGVDRQELLADFWQLGVDLFPVSAEHGDGVDDLLETIADEAPREVGEDVAPHARCAVVGRPNVGKSTLVNTLLGEERLVTSSRPGTTRDSVDTRIRRDGKEYEFLDTAGLRRESKISEDLEELSVVQAIRSIDRADVAVVMLEAPEGVTNQDKKIADVASRRNCGVVLVVNKWDMIDRYSETGDLYRDYLRNELHYLDWAPIVFTSAVGGASRDQLFEAIETAYESYGRRISTSTLNDFLEEAVAEHSPPLHQDRRVKIYYGTQASTRPPTFVLFSNLAEGIDDTYLGYLENRLREEYDFEGTPIQIHVRERD